MNMGKNKLGFGLLKVIGVTLIIIVVLGLVGYAIQDNTTNGTENFQGAKQSIAKRALVFDEGFNSDYPFRSLTKARVENVTQSPDGNDNQGKPLRCTDDPEDERYYSVTVRRIALFGITFSEVVYKGCNLVP